MPTPGVTFIEFTMSARVPLPRSRSPSTACALVVPAGSILPTTPSKMMLVASPSTRGANAVRITDPMIDNTTTLIDVR
ncbi:Uncharacterised protein [Mycobacteroides abscessus subsp. abscessus]|nr:Uncharacterised protein [Mycobacteroides abscessus subsp. abscessus]